MSLKVSIQTVEPITIAEEDVSIQYIKETLSIYKSEYIYLDSAIWNNSELIGWFKLEHYPFTKEEHIDYVTASMLMLYLSQLGYIYTRKLCEKNLLPFNIRITTQEFFHLRDAGNIVFVEFDKIKFRKRIAISESPLQIKMRLTHVRIVRGSPIGNLSFEVGRGIFTGYATVVIIRNQEEN